MKILLRENRHLRVWVGTLLLVLCQLLAWAAPGDIKVEAESAALTGVSVVTSPAGYSGSGYVWNFDDANDKITFTVPATAGEYELSIIYYSPYGEKHCGVQVNSAASLDQKFNDTGGGFSSVSVGKFQLTDGANTVTITNGWGYYGIDYILFTPVAAKPPVVVPLVNGRAEAELGELSGTESSTTPAGFSGAGYVTSFDNATDKVTISFNATGGLYNLSVGYTSPYGEKGYDFQVNDEKGSGMFVNTGNTFSSVVTGRFLLKDGLNTVVIGRGWGYFGIDYIEVTPATATLPTKPPKLLVDAQATASTKAMFAYIVDQYGSKVISAQHDDIDYVLEKTGKEPAIASYDLIEYSPSRIEFGSNPAGQSESRIAWAKKGAGNGMVSLMWHWNAPTDLINQAPDKLWWRGFYTDATTFDIAAVLADKSGTRYQLLLRDIDAIAVELKKFRDADIPVLWRPLHEAPGGWFWWGAKGPGPLKELWHIMYDRLTNYHDLHNLIWVYTGTDTLNMDWYPGDQYVDVVGLDIYADPTANMSGNWANTQALFNGKKLVTLSETGNLPKPENVRGFATWWSWFSVWTGTDYIRKQPIDLLQAVYNDKDVITRDELPDWRTYGQLTLTAPAYNCQTGAITFQTTGGDGTPIEFRAIGITDWTTNPNNTVEPGLRGDPKVISLTARQSGHVVTYDFDLPTFCSGQGTNKPPVFNGPLAPQSTTVGAAFSYQVPAEAFTDPENAALTMTAANLPAGLSFTANTRTISGIPTTFGSFQVTLTAADPLYAATSGPLLINVANAGGMQPLTLIEPLYNCATGALTLRTSGGDGTPIRFFCVGVAGNSTATDYILEAAIRNDANSQPLEIRATQSGITTTPYPFDWRAFCQRNTRIAAPEATETWSVRSVGNPVSGEFAIEVRGAEGIPLQVTLTDLNGRLIDSRVIIPASATHHDVFDLRRQAPGLLLLRAVGNTRTQTLKVLKQ